MSQENVDVVRAAVEAFNRGNLEAAFKDAAPNFEWDNSRSINADTRGVFTLSGILEVFRRALEVWESAWIEIHELIPVGDYVVLPHAVHFRGRDGIEAQARTTWVFTIRNGMMERGCLYQDRQDALEAVGLSEQDAHADSS
jgi:ketosteroid isomerase-like protein